MKKLAFFAKIFALFSFAAAAHKTIEAERCIVAIDGDSSGEQRIEIYEKLREKGYWPALDGDRNFVGFRIKENQDSLVMTYRSLCDSPEESKSACISEFIARAKTIDDLPSCKETKKSDTKLKSQILHHPTGKITIEGLEDLDLDVIEKISTSLGEKGYTVVTGEMAKTVGLELVDGGEIGFALTTAGRCGNPWCSSFCSSFFIARVKSWETLPYCQATTPKAVRFIEDEDK